MEHEMVATLREKIGSSLIQARGRASRLQRAYSSLVTMTVIAGALSTVLAGVSAASGSAVLGSEVTGWRLTCGLVAFLTFLGTAAAGINQQFQLSERLGEARRCAGRLSALELALGMGNVPTVDAAHQYTELVAEYQSVLD